MDNYKLPSGIEAPLKLTAKQAKNLPPELVEKIKAKEEAEGSPVGMFAINPMTGMPQANQMMQSPMNPVALGGLQNKIPGITGQAVDGMYDRILPTPLTKYKK
jgi:hypothetical protein